MKKNVMARSASAVIAGLLLAVLGSAMASDHDTVVVAVPARAGAVDGTTQNSDEFIWNLFTQFAAPVYKEKPSPVVFETWASDLDTFAASPRWPSPDEPKKLQRSRLGAKTTPHHSPIDVPCNPPAGAAVGGFPTSGTPTPCIAEEVKRNRPQFDYIVSNNLNTQVGLAAAYAKSFKVTMPTSAISVKGDWIPVQTMLQWIPQLGSVEKIRTLYYMATVDSVEYALVSLHVSSRQNPNWVWGTFEHQMNPGRCDSIGCFDTFGSTIPVVRPNKATVNAQYGACPKTEPLKALMAKANLSTVWENYCLKSSQVDYTAADGTPYVLGNSVIEGITGNGTVAASSCIGCHVYASFGSTGTPTTAVQHILPYNPTGQPIPAVLDGSLQYDFMWGVLNAAAPVTTATTSSK
ncbi:MAG TPA: hypothetical protein VEL74_09095 [Thermoanaerobaculia bacterium]|nr:hypothetical protein [Thermoanaerobaculia bacterium]